MGLRRGQKAPIKPPPADGEEAQDPIEDVDQLPWEEDLAQWEAEEKQENEYSRLVLYRRQENNKGQEKVFEWVDENPGSHAIGMEFGGGRYTAYLILPPRENGGKPRIRTRHFILASSYTEKKRIRDREAGYGMDPRLSFGHPGNQQSREPQISEFEKIALIFDKMVMPMMEIMMKNQAAAPVAVDPMKMFPGMASMMNDVVLQGARSQIALSKEMVKELSMATAGRPQKEEADPDEPTDFDWKDFLKEAIREYGPQLIEATGLKAKAAAAMLRGNEVFQTLAANKVLFDRVHALLTQDPDVDKGQLQKVLEKMAKLGLGLNVKPSNGHAAAHPISTGPATHAA